VEQCGTTALIGADFARSALECAWQSHRFGRAVETRFRAILDARSNRGTPRKHHMLRVVTIPPSSQSGGSAATASAATFDEMFLDRTMRVNYFHTGNHGEELIAIDSVVSDGPWPGSRSRLIDTLNLGNYYFEVVDRDTNQAIYSRGFASVFGEAYSGPHPQQSATTVRAPVQVPKPTRRSRRR